jgi:hypothetical protein
MQAVHEFGHVVGAWLTGGRIEKIVLYPLTISRTDLAANPRPLIVVWAGPAIGVALPLLIWSLAAVTKLPGAFVLRFFAGFCLIANGAYISGGSFDRIGDCGVMLHYGSPIWQLWLFGAVTAPIGLWLWHRQGPRFGLGNANGVVNRRVMFVMLAVCLAMVGIEFAAGNQ